MGFGDPCIRAMLDTYRRSHPDGGLPTVSEAVQLLLPTSPHVISRAQNAPSVPGPLPLEELAQCPSLFPARSVGGLFRASAFQERVLRHMQVVRMQCGHKHGLVVLATGTGKTVLAILDIASELASLADAVGLPPMPSPPQPPTSMLTVPQCPSNPDTALCHRSRSASPDLLAAENHVAPRGASTRQTRRHNSADRSESQPRRKRGRREGPEERPDALNTATNEPPSALRGPAASASIPLGSSLMAPVLPLAPTPPQPRPPSSNLTPFLLGQRFLPAFSEGCCRLRGTHASGAAAPCGCGNKSAAVAGRPQEPPRAPFLVLALAHTTAIRDALCAKFRAHFGRLGFPTACFAVLAADSTSATAALPGASRGSGDATSVSNVGARGMAVRTPSAPRDGKKTSRQRSDGTVRSSGCTEGSDTDDGDAVWRRSEVAGAPAAARLLSCMACFVFGLFQSMGPAMVQASAGLGPCLIAVCPRLTHLLIDEAHHALAPSYLALLRALQRAPHLQYVLGMTATLQRRDDPNGDAIKRLFRGVVYVDVPWTVAKQLGHFPPVEYLECLPTLRGGRDIPTYGALIVSLRGAVAHLLESGQPVPWRPVGDFLELLENSLGKMGMQAKQQVHAHLTPAAIAARLVQYQKARLHAGLAPRSRILVFTSTCVCADQTAALLRRAGVRAAAAHSRLGRDVAEDALARFREGDLNALCTVMMVQEGYDLPGIDCVVLARVTESEVVFVQQMGRGLRRDASNPGKEFTVLDLALNLRRRWRRLRGELSTAQLAAQICEFWDVSNFVGDEEWVTGEPEGTSVVAASAMQPQHRGRAFGDGKPGVE